MSTSRRDFLKNSAIAGAGVALDVLPGLASPVDSASAPGGAVHSAGAGDAFTRGIGIYPGDPHEGFSPELVIDSVNYRNLALFRPAYHSSSYDYNLTAQLVADGIKDTRLPDWVAVATSSMGALPKNQRELLLNHSRMSPIALFGANPSLEIGLGGSSLPEVDRIDIIVVPTIPNSADLSFTITVSDDGSKWEKVGTAAAPKPASVDGYPPDFVRPGHLFVPSIHLNRVCTSRFYRWNLLSRIHRSTLTTCNRKWVRSSSIVRTSEYKLVGLIASPVHG